MPTIYGGLKVSEEVYERAMGCGSCKFGLALGTPAPPMNGPLYLGLLSQFRANQLVFCDCSAGEMMRRSMERTAAEDDQYTNSHTDAIARSAEARLSRLFADARVPDKFAELTTKGYVELAGREPGRQDAIKAVKEYYRNGSVTGIDGVARYGIFLHGKTDMGKTGLLCPLFLHYVKEGESGLWIQYNDMQAAVRDFGSEKVEERITTMQQVAYLFVDDWGDPLSDKVASDYSREVMQRIIDYRNNYRKPTFVTSNLSPAKLGGQFHERIAKRLAELCAVIEVTGAPMRELVRV